MTLNELRFIVAVAQERNFRRAAEKAFISQPALSLAIQKLEDELGLKIFERGKNEVSLTPVGSAIVEQAQRVLEEAEYIREIAAQGKNQLSTPLRIGIIHSVSPYLLPDLIPELRKLAPHMALEVEENITANLEALLRNGKLDVIIIALPFGDAGILTRPLYDESFEVVVNSDHRWATRRSIKPADLSAEKVLLLDSGHCYSNQVAEACPDSRKGNDVQHGTSLETIRNMVASGLGITVLPASANSARYRSKLLSVIPFTKPAPSRRIALAWRKSYARTQAIEVLAQAVSRSRITGIHPLE
ncbi:MAG: hydrogen peroxide-inducible genes activator [Gammaproteobacteria bacterium]|nr:hydrogen peroxide-inducible genes activator [Gammaproteobacteria bacterium]MBU1447747.1 hydrogen peroxide-inducible genes activator [Gammaproteobacteria bacterium]